MTTFRFDDLRQYSDVLRSRSGNAVTVRFVEPRDAAALQNYFRSLTTRSRYNRFLGATRELPPSLLDQFIDLIRRNGARPIYVIMGGFTDSPDIQRRLQYSRKGAELAREKGVPVFDSQEVVSGYNGNKSELFSPSGVHWSREGARLLAQFIDQRAFADYNVK